ncbi:MAG: hypothetical protein M3340_18315 [Actinomycetota bacterium]|nr:hypothetical protein [Actinomycetota bacterium]
MADLEIQAIELSEPYAVEPPEGATGEPIERVSVRIDARNTSPDTTLHAISEARRIQFDEATGTLFLGLSDPPPEETPEIFHQFAPAQTPVLPNETATLEVSVPRVIRLLRVGEGEGLSGIAYDEVDMSQVRRVECEVAYADTPFRRAPDQSAREMNRELSERTTTTRVELPVRLGRRADRKGAQ